VLRSDMDPVIFQNTSEGRKAFQDLAFRVIEWIEAYYQRIESFPVRSQVQPGDVYKHFNHKAPPEPASTDALFETLEKVILPGITHWQHPHFYAFFPGNTSFPSIAAEMLTAGISAQCMLWESSPAATELEQRCAEWCRDLLGLPGTWSGVINDTASTATLTALLTAREWKSDFKIARHGFNGAVYRIYTSAQAHSSVEKAVRLAGFGTDNLVFVDTDAQLSMKPDRLEAAILADLREGFIPTAVVSTIGTTGTGAIDPLAPISAISKQYGLWHHVDAAYTGTALMLEEYAHLRGGLDGADSFVFNPHKWMFVQFDCSMYYVKDPRLLTRTMSITPSYLKTAQGSVVNDYRDWGIPLGRRFRALKLWMTLHMLGTEAIKQRLRHHIMLGKSVEALISNSTNFELAYPRSFNINTFAVKRSTDPDGAKTRQLSAMINASGKAYMTHATIEGQSVIRWVTGQTYTEQHHIDGTWQLILKLIDQLN
jgi:aromatic-L-amino-acid/L-tryptophan decarboxylase